MALRERLSAPATYQSEEDPMTTIYSVVNQPNDQFGYSCYALVIPASEALTAQVEQLRNSVGVTVASIPAHITVKGTFFEIESLEAVRQAVREITRATAPFDISFDGASVHWWSEVAALTVPVSPPLQALHDRLVARVAPMGLPAYRDDPYVAHMTLVYNPPPDRADVAKQLIGEMDFGQGFQAKAVDLMGRVGPRYGGEWQRIERFGLGAGE
jgi:2'-5' RNA ligase